VSSVWVWFQRPNPKSLTGRLSRLWHRVAHGKCVGVDSGVDIRGGYSQLRHRVTYTIFFFVFGLSSSHPILSLETAFVHILCKVDTLNPFLFKTNGRCSKSYIRREDINRANSCNRSLMQTMFYRAALGLCWLVKKTEPYLRIFWGWSTWRKARSRFSSTFLSSMEQYIYFTSFYWPPLFMHI